MGYKFSSLIFAILLVYSSNTLEFEFSQKHEQFYETIAILIVPAGLPFLTFLFVKAFSVKDSSIRQFSKENEFYDIQMNDLEAAHTDFIVGDDEGGFEEENAVVFIATEKQESGSPEETDLGEAFPVKGFQEEEVRYVDSNSVPPEWEKFEQEPNPFEEETNPFEEPKIPDIEAENLFADQGSQSLSRNLK